MPFHRLSLLCFVVMGLMVIGCGDNPTVDTKEDPSEDPATNESGATITGLVLPPGTNPLIIVLRNGIDVASTVTDDEGRYTLPNLTPGAYSLQVIKDPQFFTDISIRDLPVKAGEVSEAGLVILRERSQAATLLGQVVDASNGQPLPDAEVQIECATGVCAPLSAMSDREGKFSIDIWSGLGANVNVRKLGYRTQPIQVQALKPAEQFNLKQIALESLAQ
ncbi:MAG: carboxypeptidase-like regulatory domain-containing protein [Candidatus Poribacteria bacterium]|nr:carboxypeptidase-like regulatory domain-containing protein [Candidatus Poribacteria bacterium]